MMIFFWIVGLHVCIFVLYSFSYICVCEISGGEKIENDYLFGPMLKRSNSIDTKKKQKKNLHEKEI